MKQKLAVFREVLLDEPQLWQAAQLESPLFGQPLEQEAGDDWHPDFDRIFQLLHRNYQNPKAMNYFVFYDISDNKLRVQVAKYLLAKGFQRVQKSVFLGNISKNIYKDVEKTLGELEAVYGVDDSVFLVPVGEYTLEQLTMLGRNVKMDFARSSQYVLFI